MFNQKEQTTTSDRNDIPITDPATVRAQKCFNQPNTMKPEEGNTGVEKTLKKHASFEFEQWKRDHPEGFKIFERAMRDYSDQQNAELKSELNKSDVSYAQMRSKCAKKEAELRQSLSELIEMLESERGFYNSEDECGLLDDEYNRWKSAIERAKLLRDGK